VKKIIRKLYYLTTLLFFNAVRLLPLSFAVKLGGALGAFAYHLIGKSRTITEENLRKSFPEKSDDEIRKIAREVFVNQGKNAFELFCFPNITPEKLKNLISIENEEGFVKAVASDKGVLLASDHCGNWELMGAKLAQNEFGTVINVIARRIYIEGLNRLLVDLRNSKGYKVILRSGNDTAKKMLKALKSKEALAMLIDQDTEVPGVFVDFFDRPAWTPSGLAVIALRMGVPIIVTLDVRMPDDSHKVIITGPLEMIKTGDHDKDVIENTKAVTKVIENHIRKYPSQWVWMHERWKTQAM